MDSITFKKKAKRIIKPAIVFFILYLIIFRISFFFMPLRFPPDKIVVYKYGEVIEFKPGDFEYIRLYLMLRKSSRSTIYKAFSVDAVKSVKYPMDIHDAMPTQLEKGLAIRVVYEKEQRGRLPLSYETKYNELLFLLDFEMVLDNENPKTMVVLHDTAKGLTTELIFSLGMEYMTYPADASAYIKNKLP